jgi:hypothetical protein
MAKSAIGGAIQPLAFRDGSGIRWDWILAVDFFLGDFSFRRRFSIAANDSHK